MRFLGIRLGSVFQLMGVAGVEPDSFWLYPQKVVPTLPQGVNSNPLEGTHPTYCVYSAEDSNDKEHRQCSKYDH